MTIKANEQPLMAGQWRRLLPGVTWCRCLDLRAAAVAALVAVLAIGPDVGHAQAPNGNHRVATAGRTASGEPDLQGTWNYSTMTPLERPREFAGKAVLTEQEAAAYERQRYEQQTTFGPVYAAGPDWWDAGTRHLTNRRTSLIVDPPTGRMPELTADAVARAAARVQAARTRGPADGPEDLPMTVRCLQSPTAGPPMVPGNTNNNVTIVQTRGYVTFIHEMIHDAKIVPMDGRPHGTLPRWMGDPTGHWEGATLVVDSVSFNDKTSFRGSDERLHLVERFTRVSANTIEYRFTIDDPTVWTQPWTAAFPLTRSAEPMYEFACHEGNYRSLEGIFKGARIQNTVP